MLILSIFYLFYSSYPELSLLLLLVRVQNFNFVKFFTPRTTVVPVVSSLNLHVQYSAETITESSSSASRCHFHSSPQSTSHRRLHPDLLLLAELSCSHSRAKPALANCKGSLHLRHFLRIWKSARNCTKGAKSELNEQAAGTGHFSCVSHRLVRPALECVTCRKKSDIIGAILAQIQHWNASVRPVQTLCIPHTILRRLT